MQVDSNYQEHVSIMKNLQMGDSFYEAREPYKESFEKIYKEAKEKDVTISNAKEFLNSLSKGELSTLQHYTLLVNDIDVDNLSDEGAYNLLLHHYEKYDFNKDGIIEDGIGKTQSLIPQSLDSTAKKALVDTFNEMGPKEAMMASFVMLPLNIKIENGQIVPAEPKNYSYQDIIDNIKNVLDPKSQCETSTELKNVLSDFLDSLQENFQKEKENQAVLESYKRT